MDNMHVVKETILTIVKTSLVLVLPYLPYHYPDKLGLS